MALCFFGMQLVSFFIWIDVESLRGNNNNKWQNDRRTGYSLSYAHLSRRDWLSTFTLITSRLSLENRKWISKDEGFEEETSIREVS